MVFTVEITVVGFEVVIICDDIYFVKSIMVVIVVIAFVEVEVSGKVGV